MACSKIFSGDLPELINEIIQYFHNDSKTLHSCILVNRLWCRFAIPLLWEDPFSIKFLKNYHFIEIYLHNINEDDRTKLKEYGIYNELFPSNTLFNYPSFIQCFDTHKVHISIHNWIIVNVNSKNELQHSSHFMHNTNLSYNKYKQMFDFTKLIYRLLLLIFIESEVKLKCFKIKLIIDKDHEIFDSVFELILQNPNFICNIKNLTLDFGKISDNITKFLMFLYSNCNLISSLYFTYPYNYNHIVISEKRLSQIINSQENLRKITLEFNDKDLPCNLLLSLKNTNCLNTLNTIIFYYMDFENINILNEVFNQLNVLESVHLIYCQSLDSKFVQKIDGITKSFKLKTLFLRDILQIESLVLLIQKFGNYIENFEVISYNNPQQLLQLLLESIIKYCTNIKFLCLIFEPNYEIIHLVINLIKNIKQNLNYLSIHTTISTIRNNFDDYYLDNYLVFDSIILQNLGQILPSKLEYLNLSLMINNGNDLEVFLKNSQKTFINKLLIYNKKNEENEEIFFYIKEYIMRK
ncbi:hypothetical protein RclHR1_04740010 [Rhizophagus clarus]|uniref:F-box domain-containing protein n=1 Tax=Rhizophagus clarus TaxID=94130 RepID=A0A2Z6SCI0_9GLOM|nr:hypothetical protein RclHR1_04740010 [Rhizophagus clarus]